MAGYIIYSLDRGKFERFVKHPTPGQLAAFARLLSDGLEELDGEFDEGDPVAGWPTDATALAPIAAKRLATSDWYKDLSATGKTLWEGAVFNACMNCDEIDVGFRAENDGLGWDVLEFAWKRLGVVPGQISDVALSAFGTRPYRYHARAEPAQTRDRLDKEEAERRSSLSALSGMLGQFLKSAKQGQADPSKLLDQLNQNQAVTEQHKQALKGVLGDADEGDSEDWQPMHSMHTLDEVRTMLVELRSLKSALKKAKTNVRRQFDEDLLPAINTVASEGRILFVQVDT
jgi:hypothetical protein